ncbi:Protein transport protein got1 [Schizosaccharomyces pombe]|uniref:Protein transport protein got1 n=1 Tax=Schizosaccharomyces pombe (strain 972 / ATCC 24843) TaxID=284812 RepID=GOT1_SCHPO|nr:putative transport protein Got1 [Schizosaccharomyces pombe]Q9USJ2.1 RecName: Full=Protein transport protein got1; AltName: Full=Golgi transport protein 1 [Schizosaccharomyces pombe 972h-]CAB60676.1 Golgi transport protein Got1 (predicted) [Schizosaccharomyces pombe]|eukprot:NP_588088.1 putative transport protein Got1 [Schizosaccharomyces pombe]
MWLSDLQKIGVGTTALGFLFMIMGIFMFFDGPLLSLGNLLLVFGFFMIAGFSKSVSFFLRKDRMLGSISFFSGLLLTLFHFPIIGFFVECLGFFNLFKVFYPLIISFLRTVPYIGPYIDRLTSYQQSPV